MLFRSEDELLDINNDIAKAENDIELAKGTAGKAPFKKKLKALEAKKETISQRMDAAYAAYEKVKKQLGHKH